MKIEDRIAMNRSMAEGYRNAYLRQGVQTGEDYAAWKFAENAEYVSPYWTEDKVWILEGASTGKGQSSTLEAKAIMLVFPDWKPVDCQIWASDDGFVMKNKWEGHKKDGTLMGYYSYTFARTNERGEITRWETHVNEDFGPFIEAVIGIRGPFRGRTTYMDAVTRAVKKGGGSV